MRVEKGSASANNTPSKCKRLMTSIVQAIARQKLWTAAEKPEYELAQYVVLVLLENFTGFAKKKKILNADTIC